MTNLSIGAVQYSSNNLTPGVHSALETMNSRVTRAACKRFHGFEAALKLLKSDEERPYMSGPMMEVQNAGTSFTFMQRSIAEHPLLDATLGNATEIVPFLAYAGYLGAAKSALQAEKLGYKAGVRAAEEDMFKAKVTGGTATLYLGVRGLSLAAYVKGIDTSSLTAPTLLGRVTYALSNIGTALWGFVYALSLRKHINAGYDVIKFLNKMNASLHIARDIKPTHEELERYIGFFKKWTLTGSAEEIAKKVLIKHTHEEFVQEALSTASELLVQVAKKPLTPLQVRTLLSEIMGVKDKELDEALTMLGFELKVAKLKMKRALKLETMTSSACVKEMEKLAEELRSNAPRSIEEMKAFVEKTRPLAEKMKSESSKNICIHAAYAFSCLVGVAASITALCATGGVAGLVVAILFTLVSVTMTALDGYNMYQAVQNCGKKGTFDETMYFISNTIYMISMVLALVTVYMLSLGIGMAIAAIVIASTGMGLNIYVRQQLTESDAKYAEEHPTLALFHTKMKKWDQERLRALFDKLSESDREALNEVQDTLTSERAKQLACVRLKEIAEEEKEKRAILASLQRQITQILART